MILFSHRGPGKFRKIFVNDFFKNTDAASVVATKKWGLGFLEQQFITMFTRIECEGKDGVSVPL